MKEIKLVCRESDVRLDLWLSRQIKDYSRTYLRRLIEEGRVLVNDKVTKGSRKMSPGDRVILNIPAPVSPDLLAQDIPLNIIYEDGDIIVIAKPKGMVVHPAGGNRQDTLVNALLGHCKDDLSDAGGVLRPGIVHRLDKDTSGLVVAAKNNYAHKRLSDAFKDRQVDKVYEGIARGVIRENKGFIDLSLSRHPGDRKKFAHVPGKGKDARTSFTVLERFDGATHVEILLHTGRTHQIRVHFAHIGHPLLGDRVYSRAKNKFKFEGQVLHARRLGFSHPRSGQRMDFEAPLPEYFKDLLGDLKKISRG